MAPRAHGVVCRIIPAYAGSTPGAVGIGTAHWDHPRIRGEHVGLAWEGVKTVGSSPHTRGAHRGVGPVGGFAGIIPAYAGSTEPGDAGVHDA